MGEIELITQFETQSYGYEMVMPNLNRIDLDEMYDEAKRLKTFKDWPLKFITGEKLAKAGFFYENLNDAVTCAFCGVTIGKWEPRDDAFEEHKKFEPRCRFVQGMARKNVPLRGRVQTDTYAVNDYKYGAYSERSKRLESFKEWPMNMKQRPEDLADAGLFYTGKGDQTLCFHCGVGLKQWEEDDVPWFEHTKFNPDCPFVEKMGYKERLDMVESKNVQQSPSEDRKVNVETAVEQLDDQVSCTLCFTRKRSILFMPCQHLMSCAECSARLEDCPMCRTKLESCIKVKL